MEQEFLDDERRIIEVLEAAGWQRTAQSVALGTASMIHSGPAMTLEAEQDYGKHELIITMTAPDGLALTLFAEYGDGLDRLLDALVASQDTITLDNFRDHARQWLAACPTIWYQEDEDSEPQLLSPE